MTRITSLLSLLIYLALALTASAQPATVFAAASLRGALDAATAQMTPPPRLSYGGSGSMARQIAAGAPADLVILASGDWMDWLEERGHVRPDARRSLFGNRLVLIAPRAAPVEAADPADIAAALGDGRLAMGHRSAVPAGQYAAQWLRSTDQWDALRDRLAETDNVRAALALVSRAQARLGIVYATDARADPGVEVLAELDPQGHDPIVYYAAALTPAGADLLAALQTSEAAAIFRDHGFTVTE